MVEKVRQYFRDNYGYINLSELSDVQIDEFMNQSYVKGKSFERQMDLLQDNILANGLAEVQE